MTSNIDGPVPWAQRDEVALVQGELNRVDDLINRLHKEKRGLLRRINSLQASTRRLPSEILSTIFQHARPLIDFNTRETPLEVGLSSSVYNRKHFPVDDFQLVLGAVSFHWRQVAWSTPQLWTTLSIEPRSSTASNNEALLNLYFQNARDLPMTIELDFRETLYSQRQIRSERRAKSISYLDSFRTTIFTTNVMKIRSLILIATPHEWVPFIGKNLVNCEVLRLRWPEGVTYKRGDRFEGVALGNLPRLRHLQLKNLAIIPPLPWSTITILELRAMSVRKCVELLARCPNLVRFESRDPFWDDRGEPSSTKIIVLEHLEVLEWCDIGDPWGFAFLECVRFTKLRRLVWSVLRNFGYEGDLVEFGAKLSAFISDLPVTLEIFQFSSCDISIPYCRAFFYFKDLLGSLDHLPSLWIDVLNRDCVHCILSMIGRPVTESIASGSNRRSTIVGPKESSGTKFLAALESLALQDGSLFDMEIIVEMLEALEGARTATGYFRLELMKKGRWQPISIEKIKGLLTRGFELEVIEEGVPLDFTAMSASGGP